MFSTLALALTLWQPPQHTVPSQRPAAAAEAPFVKLPSEVAAKSGTFIVVQAETNGKTIRWLPLDAGLTMIPGELLRDTKAAVCMAPKGRYRLLAYTALADESSPPAITTITVDGATEPPPPKPTDPPTNPPAPSGSFYFVVVRPDGPADPLFTRVMGDPAWQELVAKGHVVKDFTLTEARAAGADVPPGTLLPCVITLRVSADRKSSTPGRGPVPLPDTSDKIRALPEGVK